MKKNFKNIIKILIYGFILFLIIRISYKISNPLYRAYFVNSEEKMESIFQDWNKKYSNNYNKLNNDTIRLIYDVFDAFYTPRDLKRIGDSEWGDSIYVHSKYLLVQDRIEYTILKSYAYFDSIYNDSYVFLNENDSVLYSELKVTDSILYCEMLQYFKSENASGTYTELNDFRPKTIYDKGEIIYNSKKFNKQINRYLGKRYIDFGFSNIMSPARPRKSNKNRQEFLNPYFVVWQGHWGGYWHLFSHPLVTGITLENDLKTAHVDYRVVYEFGVATLKKVDRKWILIESEMTGIE